MIPHFSMSIDIRYGMFSCYQFPMAKPFLYERSQNHQFSPPDPRKSESIKLAWIVQYHYGNEDTVCVYSQSYLPVGVPFHGSKRHTAGDSSSDSKPVQTVSTGALLQPRRKCSLRYPEAFFPVNVVTHSFLHAPSSTPRATP